MPRGGVPGRKHTNKRQEVHITLRAIIIYVRTFHPTLTFNDLEHQIGVPASTASEIFRAATARANCGDFHEVLACCTPLTDANSSRNSQLPLVADGTTDSARVRDAIMQNPYLSFHEAALTTGIQISRRTADKIAHDHRDEAHPYAVVRRIPSHKLPLNIELMDLRVEFAEWALERLNEGAIFVFCDETWWEWYGQATRRKKRVSMAKGANSADFSIWEKKKSPVRFMQSGIVCEDLRIQRRTHFWIPESKDEKTKLSKLLEQRNEVILEETASKIERSHQPGTKEHCVLQEINANIQLHNDKVKAEGGGQYGKGLKRKKDAHQVFKPTLLTRDQKGGGQDWLSYEQKVLLPLYLPYLREVKAANPGKKVYFVSDYASLHVKAMDINTHLFEKEGIEIAPWPTNSPDLNPIEPCWGYEKDMLEDYNIGGTTAEELQILKGWIENEFVYKMGPFIEHTCKGFKHRLELCIKKNGITTSLDEISTLSLAGSPCYYPCRHY